MGFLERLFPFFGQFIFLINRARKGIADQGLERAQRMISWELHNRNDQSEWILDNYN